MTERIGTALNIDGQFAEIIEANYEDMVAQELPFGVAHMTKIAIERSNPLSSDAPDSFSDGKADDKLDGSND